MEAADPANPRSQSELRLGPVEVPKASDVLAGELRERILTGELAEGEPLPAERELVKQAQMSRATVREALRILEVQNLVRVKTGRAGGAFVQRPTTNDGELREHAHPRQAHQTRRPDGDQTGTGTVLR